VRFMDDDGIIDDVAPSPLALSAEPGRPPTSVSE